jgi:choline dehydrogenase-like flavoprotein
VTTRAVDVLIIGAGPSGGVFARRLVEAGLSVVALEQGDWTERAAYPGATPDWEIVGPLTWSSQPNIRCAPGDSPIDQDDAEMRVSNYHGVGGGTILFNGQWPRMLPDDFRVRSVDGVADDWPLTYAELQPYYEETDRQFGISGLGGNPAYPPGADPPLPPLPIGPVGLRIARAHAKLGWHWWPEPNAILSDKYDGRNPCVQRGTCVYGCNEGAKGSADLTHWGRVVAAGGTVVTGARVRRIVLDAGGLACGAEWLDAEGVEHFTAADVVVCAANAVGTARLLLASASPRHPNGLANGSGLVGRRLMLHPLMTVTGLFDEPLQAWRSHAGGLVQCLEFVRSDPSRGFVRGAKWALGSSGGPLKALYAPDGLGVWGPRHHAHVRERLGRSATWAILGEDLPELDNCVDLSPTVTDRFGLPAARVHYRLSENSRRLMAFQADRARESLEAAGAWRVDVTPHPSNGHTMGTARMGDDPSSSVVDRWNVTHEVRNLLVVDGSVFVTAGAANPTTTIVSLALRAADRLLDRRRDIPTPQRPTTTGGFGGAVSRPRPIPAALATRPLDAADRARLGMIAGEVIPEADAMPAAPDVEDFFDRVDHVLRLRPDRAADLRRALGLSAESLDHDPAALDAVRYVIAAAYYLSPEVRRRLSYEPEPAAPVSVRAFPEYVDEGLLDHLFA